MGVINLCTAYLNDPLKGTFANGKIRKDTTMNIHKCLSSFQIIMVQHIDTMITNLCII